MTAARYGSDEEVLTALLDWHEAGHGAVLVTVLRSWGSSPRPPGSLLAIRLPDGRQVGSVSGGCVEEDLVRRVLHEEVGGYPGLIDYGVDPAGAARFGLPCGGQLELLLEKPEPAALQPLLRALRDGRLLQRRVCLNTGEASLHPAKHGAAFHYAEHTIHKTFGPQWQLLLVGAGQIGDCLTPIAESLGFVVTINDPRPEFRDSADRHDMPDDLLNDWPTPARCAVVTLAHDPKLDDLALIAALQGTFFYVGALGSKRSAAAREERLQQMDIHPGQLARLHAPVGLDLGSHSPAEIAVSIAAELTAVRNGLACA